MNFKRMKHILCTPSRVTNSQWQLFIISCCLHHHCRSWLLLLHDFFYFFIILFFSIESLCIFVKKRVLKNLQKKYYTPFALSLSVSLSLCSSPSHMENAPNHSSSQVRQANAIFDFSPTDQSANIHQLFLPSFHPSPSISPLFLHPSVSLLLPLPNLPLPLLSLSSPLTLLFHPLLLLILFWPQQCLLGIEYVEGVQLS